MRPILFTPPISPYLVHWDRPFRVSRAATAPPKKSPPRDECEERLEHEIERVGKLQKKLFADDRYSVLLVFQAMDAAGKDGTIRAVLTGVNPAGCQVFSFKAPSAQELDHDFLWRNHRALPERGRIGVWNRSHYEEVVIARVHPEILERQKLPRVPKDVWSERYESIREMEQHLARNGTVILKFWLNVSRDEQRRRFLDRIEDEDANWKFNSGDIEERAHWDEYMNAYEEALTATSRPWAPWYAVPADDKPFMRLTVARIVAEALDALDLRYPEIGRAEKKQMKKLGRALARGET